MQLLRQWFPSLTRATYRNTHTPGEETQREWNENGFVVLRNAVDHELIDRLNGEITEFRRTCGEGKDEFGYGQRIGLFHAQNRRSLQVALNPRVREFLSWAFKDDPVLFGTLTFEAGTEQSAHRDNIFFQTDPQHCMAGAWAALEDVHETAGPLFYIPGSHKWPVVRGEDVRKAFPDWTARLLEKKRNGAPWAEMVELANEGGALWHKHLHADIVRRDARSVPAIIKKGDILVWHSLLVHGGLARTDRRLSRKSMVAHFIGRNSRMWDMNTYFLSTNAECTRKNAMHMHLVEDELGPYFQLEKPVTYRETPVTAKW
jgi:ectoine hydroxylase-related dioxygenase (phytanoyl-CoA dioxygenase family)